MSATDDTTHSAATMMGNGKEAFPRAATTDGREEKVRFGELSRWYCDGRRWLPRASPQ